MVGLAQVTLERQVMSSFALHGSGSVYISSTGGQVEYNTGGSGTILTQGFEQPPSASLLINYLVEYPACGSEAELVIADIMGCASEIDQIVIDGIVYEVGNVFLPAGEYQAEINTGAGCTAALNFTVDSEQLLPCDIFFPNIVTSNGDGSNDFWEILNLGLPLFSENHVSIYNRWGQLVWQIDNYDNISARWEGFDTDGQLLPGGTYFYEFKASDGLVFDGFIELFR